MIHPFDPVYDERSRILILGSFPSVQSREKGFYYANPNNRFWRVLAGVYEDAVPKDREGKIEYLLKHRLALWDALASCEVKGSADADIKSGVANDLSLILSTSPIERVIANGQLAGKIMLRSAPMVQEDRLFIMPSTSPANAAWQLERLVEVWAGALQHKMW